MTVIDMFSGEFSFLSNFYPCRIHMDGLAYPSVEHAYQAAKTDDPIEREAIRLALTAGRAKRLGSRVTLRKDWLVSRVNVMRMLLIQKFREPGLRDALDATRPCRLIEKNSWGDVFWGVCEGEGENRLGSILMEIRDSVPHPSVSSPI